MVPESAPQTSRMARTGPMRSPSSVELASQFTCSSSKPTTLIELSGQGRRVNVGRYVRPELRPVLAQEIRRALRGG